MSLVSPTPITALNGITPPSTGSPTDFDPRADEFLGAFPALQSQINTISQQTNENAEFAQTKAAEALVSQTAAANSEAAAAASAISASTAGNAVKWQVSTNFSEGECCWSPVDFQTYRKITPGTSTTPEPTDPAGESVWRSLTRTNHLANLIMGII